MMHGPINIRYTTVVVKQPSQHTQHRITSPLMKHTTHNRTLRSPHTQEHALLILTFWRRNYFLNFSTPVYKGTQLLISTETSYELPQSDKELHTEHTPLRNNFTLTPPLSPMALGSNQPLTEMSTRSNSWG